MTQVGRNDPCPCGSGRKYKHCCLRSAEVADHASALLRRDEERVVATLLAFADEFYGPHLFDEAWADFFVGADIPEPDLEHPLFHTVFVPWFLFDFAPDPDRRRKRRSRIPHGTVAATYLELYSKKLSESECRFVRAGCQTALSFHLVSGVRPGRGLDLQNLLTGECRPVVERSGSNTLKIGAVLLARVLASGESGIMSGCAPLVLPPLWRTHVLDLRRRLADASGWLTVEEVRAAGSEVLEMYHSAADAILNPIPPKLVNTDGEPIDLITLRFTLRCSVREAFDRLKALSLEHDENALLSDAEYDERNELRVVSLVWAKRGNRVHKEWENTILGHLEIDGTSLTASLNSRGRARRARRLIEKRLGQAVAFEAEVRESVARTLASRDGSTARGAGPGRQDEGEFDAQPAEVRAALEESLARRWEQWLDDRIPALAHLTPREAAATPDGRERLEALLAEYAWENESAPAHLRVDVAGLRARLGLGSGVSRDGSPQRR